MIKTILKINTFAIVAVILATAIVIPRNTVQVLSANKELNTDKTIKKSRKEERVVITTKVAYKKDSPWGYLLASSELPLYQEDYYWGKFINAKAAAFELNTIPGLKPSDKVSIIKDGFLIFDKKSGYIKPGEGFYYGSGVCWTVSTFGSVMDSANKEFEKLYNMPLFVFEKNDRWGHRTTYKTYSKSNGGYGYAVIKNGEYGDFDYTYMINPDLSEVSELKELEIKIEVIADQNSPKGFRGQSVKANLYTNIKLNNF